MPSLLRSPRTQENDTAHKNTTCAESAGPSNGDRHSADAAGEILLVYDWECPACDTYCRAVRIPASAGRLSLVNARQSSEVMEEITKAGLDVDQGMVVKRGGRLHYGSEAIQILALLSSRSDLFNKLTHYAFRSSTLSHILYPILRTCRNLLLKAMGKTKINNLGIKGNDHF